MKRVAGVFSITLILSIVPASVQAQEGPRSDSSVSIIDSLRPRVIPRRVSPYQARSRSCYGMSQRRCSIFGALMIGGIGYLAGDASTPAAKYEYRYDVLLREEKICVAHCSMIPPRAIVFSIGGATIGGIGGWIVGRK